MASYEADCEDLSGDESWGPDIDFASTNFNDTPLDAIFDCNRLMDSSLESSLPPAQLPLAPPDDDYADDPAAFSDDSEYSLDYEYLGPRNPNYRPRDDPDSDASELSDAAVDDIHRESTAGFDMWDEDPYSTNDYTWESNDMRLTWFIKARRSQLDCLNAVAPWRHHVFWRKEKGWPRQLPFSCSTTNHDQSANALCLVLGDYGLAEQLFAIYRNRILECGASHQFDPRGDRFSVIPSSLPPQTQPQPLLSATTVSNRERHDDALTWIDSDQRPFSRTVTQKSQALTASGTQSGTEATGSSSSSDGGAPALAALLGDAEGSTGSSTSTTGNKFCETHLSVSLRRPSSSQESTSTAAAHSDATALLSAPTIAYPPTSGIISRFVPFTKYIRRSDFPPAFRQDSYLALDFEPLCLAQKYGYMAIGGLEGEFELYCCMNREQPPQKIWGTKFKSKKNVQIMTNAVQIVRWQRLDDPNEYEHMLTICMNDAGILIYKLPSHRECINIYCSPPTSRAQQVVQLYTHLRTFDGVPINDAKISHDRKQMVCVGDDSFLFLFDIVRDRNGAISFGNQRKLAVPIHLLQGTTPGTPASEMPYSSQYVSWSQSSRFFAHTSDTHNKVLVWHAETEQVQHTIDAAGYTYGIAFHPRLEGVLAFTNRYGYFHTVNLEEAYDPLSDKQKVVNILDLGGRGHAGKGAFPSALSSSSSSSSSSLSLSDHTANHTTHITAHQEITMIAFRGERDQRLRILAKINGIQWSRDGKYLYVATKKRVLAYEFLRTSNHISTLLDITGDRTREILERANGIARTFSLQQQQQQQQSFPPAWSTQSTPRLSSRKRKREEEDRQEPVVSMNDHHRASAWLEKWSLVPDHLRDKVLHETNLASHW